MKYRKKNKKITLTQHFSKLKYQYGIQLSTKLKLLTKRNA